MSLTHSRLPPAGHTGPTVVIVAAGRGSRFQGPGHKLAQPWEQGTVLSSTVAAVRQAGLSLRVVMTAARVPALEAELHRSEWVLVPESDGDPRLGMGYSIAAGVRASLDARGWLILPGDMPMVHPSTLTAIVQALARHPIVYPQYGGRRGHPVGFSPELCGELIELSGDEGARRVVARYPSEAVDVDDPGVLLDLDTQQDFQRARELLAQRSVLGTPLTG